MIKHFAYVEICKLWFNMPKIDKTQITWNGGWKSLEMGDSLAIPLFVKLFYNISVNICIINYVKSIVDYANEH